jgi:U3 small nucleolar RNA-associated protein 23
MKITRYKRVQRYLNFYKNNFSFRAPFQILIDSTFCQSALKNKVNITEQMPKYLNDSVKLFTTVCVVEETQRLSQYLVIDYN